MRIVIALGGNALLDETKLSLRAREGLTASRDLKKGQKGTAQEQMKNIERAIKALREIIEHNEVVITHGNGPQIGNLLIQQSATSEVPSMPLDVLDAMTQGQIGYFIQREIMQKTNRKSVTIITRVVVDEDDPAFKNPTKPVGPFYKTKPKTHDAKLRTNYVMDAGRGYRLVVPSPQPIKVLERKAIIPLLEFGLVVIAGGGGGIPIKGDGSGIEAVIDKDKCASLIAKEIDAEILLIVTAVPAVYKNFGKKNQQVIKKMSISEAKKLMNAGQFPEGSMKPKIEAAIEFIKQGGKKAIICGLENAGKALKGKDGTTITC